MDGPITDHDLIVVFENVQDGVELCSIEWLFLAGGVEGFQQLCRHGATVKKEVSETEHSGALEPDRS